jgi:hypothetical protein
VMTTKSGFGGGDRVIFGTIMVGDAAPVGIPAPQVLDNPFVPCHWPSATTTTARKSSVFDAADGAVVDMIVVMGDGLAAGCSSSDTVGLE